MKFATIPEAIKDLQRGRFIILIDDEDRENEGDLVLAAEKATPNKLNYMLKEARGILCVPMEGKRLDELDIPLMVQNNTDRFNTPFTVSVDARKGVSTGVSVNDRMETLKVLLDPNANPSDLVRPGHMFPLRAAKNGVLQRQGHTEAAVDFLKLADMKPVAVIAEIMKDNGDMAQLEELMEFAERHKLNIVTIADLAEYRKKQKE
ncbi:3,4-dihydroxy-2-butanone-4-phosphate synthase [Candidatus Woesearchaeota archaeon]|nr:3,4-dihydroxy-2-butanone-4-phosphate synthase [Candidatus Woesearchaeota archaeon]